ncbi:MAG: sugar transferase [Dehalococcoidia bacterium]|nr:MAG: sugar transferase [Dehalococcoidia bacterium]
MDPLAVELECPSPNNDGLVRRLRDLIAASLGLSVLWPLILLLAVLIKLDSPGPAIFKQTRVGYRGRPFTLYKFRTMVTGAEGQQPEITDFWTHKFEPLKPPGRDPRVTTTGWILRRMSLDELPQLLNVVRGEMSLVGPRPETPKIVDKFPPAYHLRHEARPGLTGLAQVNGLVDITYHEKVMYDLEYVKSQSSSLDLAILRRTVRVVLGGRGR